MTARTSTGYAQCNVELAGGGFGQFSEAALAFLEIFNGFGQIGGFEFRPHARGEKEFGVSALPEHEIAQAAVASGADQEIDIERRDRRCALLLRDAWRIRVADISRLESIQQEARRIASRAE